MLHVASLPFYYFPPQSSPPNSVEAEQTGSEGSRPHPPRLFLIWRSIPSTTTLTTTLLCTVASVSCHWVLESQRNPPPQPSIPAHYLALSLSLCDSHCHRFSFFFHPSHPSFLSLRLSSLSASSSILNACHCLNISPSLAPHNAEQTHTHTIAFPLLLSWSIHKHKTVLVHTLTDSSSFAGCCMHNLSAYTLCEQCTYETVCASLS